MAIRSKPFGGVTLTGEDAKAFESMLPDDLRAVTKKAREDALARLSNRKGIGCSLPLDKLAEVRAYDGPVVVGKQK